MTTILLTTCNSSFEANLMKGVLETNGINCFLTNENFSNLMPHYNGMMGAGIQIMIDENDLGKAQELLIPTSKGNGIICPDCSSSDVQFGLGTNKIKKIFVVLISLLAFIPFGNIRNIYYCRNCKTEFKI